MLKGLDLSQTNVGLNSGCHLVAVYLSVFVCKMGIITPTSEAVMRIN